MPRARGIPIGKRFKEELERNGYDIEKIRGLEDHKILQVYYKVMPHKVNGKPLHWRTIERAIVNTLRRRDYNHQIAMKNLAKEYGLDDLPSKSREYLPVLLRICVHLGKRPETEEELVEGMKRANVELTERTIEHLKKFLKLNNNG